MKKVIQHKRKMKKTLFVIFGVYSLVLFCITSFNPSYASEGILLDSVIESIVGVDDTIDDTVPLNHSVSDIHQGEEEINEAQDEDIENDENIPSGTESEEPYEGDEEGDVPDFSLDVQYDEGNGDKSSVIDVMASIESEVQDEDTEAEVNYNKYGLAVLAQKLGIDWENDSEKRAVIAGIENEYYGTAEQNEKIRLFLVENAEKILSGKVGIDVEESQNDEDSIEGQGNVISNNSEKSSEGDETSMDSSLQISQNDGEDVLLGGKEVTDDENHQAEDFYAENDGDETDKNPQSSTLSNPAPSNEGAQSGDTQNSSADISESQTLTKEQELVNAWETLNTAPISKSYEHNKVRVNVKAPVGSFPEKAELVIKPIDRGNVNKVAFDISFIYMYADGSTVELQPKEGTKVQVSFNYEKNEDWLNGMNNGGKLKITHTHDGNKENVDVTDKGEGSLTLDMDKFSEIEVELVKGGTDVTDTQLWTVENGDFYPITVSNGTKSFTIMDRNLGATAVADGTYYGYNVGREDHSKLGYYYQWGNNYGFPNTGTIMTDTVQVNAGGYGPNTSKGYYSSSTFIKGKFRQGYLNWSSTDNKNLRGGQGDTINSMGVGTDTDRRGPCPKGYHIPSILEWNSMYNTRDTSHAIVTYLGNVVETRIGNKGNDSENFAYDLRFPFAGIVYYSEGNIQGQGSLGYYWSSSPMLNGDSAYIFSFFDSSNFKPYRSYGFSLRCFKDSSAKILNYEYNGGTSTYTQPTSAIWWGNASLSTSSNTTKEGYIFAGWYTTPDFKERTQVTTNAISDDTDNSTITLYAKWVESSTVIFNPNGGNAGLSSRTVVRNTSISLPDAWRYGYIFDGWYTEDEGGTKIGGNGDSYTVTADITLYAHWEPAPKVRFLDGDDVIMDEEMYWDRYGNTDYGNNVYELTWYDISQNSDFEEYLLEKEGQIFLGWYKDKNLTQKFDFENTTIEGDLDLYAKWESCPNGYGVVNNKCISDDAGVHYEDGYVEIKNGDKVVYIKDRNQGASISAQKIIEIQKLKEEYNMCHDGGMALESIGPRGGNILRAPTNPESDFFGEVSDIIGDEVTTCEEIDEYISEVMPLSYGDYYYRGNNNGASRNELGVDFDSMHADVSPLAIARGFDGGVLGEDEDNGWIEGNTQDNPCNADEGEYLPTVNDWKKAMEIWSETKGYDLDIQDYDDYGYIYYDSEFMNDILVPNAGYIYTNDIYQALDYNSHDTKRDKIIDSLAILFSSPVYAFDIGGYNMYYNNNYLYLQMALSSGNRVGYFDAGGSNQLNYNDFNNIRGDDYNSKAAPVRCFIDPDYVNSIVKYTVTFDTKGGNETVPAQTVKEGKKLKEPATPTRDNYTFDGWYRSNGTKWNFDTDIVQGEMILYAKWRLCGEGFVVENNKCIPEGMELNGVIKVTGELGTMYIRDRNVGVTSDAAVNLLKLDNIDRELGSQCYNQCSDKNDYDKCYNECYGSGFSKKIKEELGTSYENIDDAYNSLQLDVLKGVLSEKEMMEYKLMLNANMISSQCVGEDNPEDCFERKMRKYINFTFKPDPELVDGDDTYTRVTGYFGEDDFNEFNDKYRDGYYWNLIDVQSYGNYYYRGNNSGVNYNDIKFEDPSDDYRITNTGDLIKKGFTEGKIGVEGQGWIDGNPNPCDPEKGEYLPTPEDWKKLMTIWGNANGYELIDDSSYPENDDEYTYYNYYFDDNFDDDGWNKWHSDLLLPYGGHIYQDTCNGEKCIKFSDWLDLWTSQNEEGNIGDLGDDYPYIEYTNHNIVRDEWWDFGGNTIATPVRCFVNPAEIPDVYVVSYETNGGDNDIPEVNVISGDTVILPTPTKANYTFGGWYRDKALTEAFEPSSSVTSDLTLYAKREEESEPQTPDNPDNPDNPQGHQESTRWNHYSGGGGNSTRNLDRGHGAADNNRDRNQGPNKSDSSEDSSNNNQGGQSYSFEQRQAYTFAKSKGITTTKTIQEANMNGNLTRIQMAKMLSQYAINVLGMEPDMSRGVMKFVDVPQSLDEKYSNAVTLSYYLGIMGQNMQKNRFRPYDKVTRAEFATALSRMIYGMSDGKGKIKYYEPHMAKLYNEGIINMVEPKMLEKRGYVMLMLMRTVK